MVSDNDTGFNTPNPAAAPPLLSLYPRAQAELHTRTLSLAEINQLILHDPAVARETARIRAVLPRGKKAYRAAKTAAAAACYAGYNPETRGRIMEDPGWVHSGYVLVEVDPPPDSGVGPETIKDAAAGLPGLRQAATSLSGTGVHFVFEVAPPPKSFQGHELAWYSLAQALNERLAAQDAGAVKADTQAHDQARLGFLAHDPAARFYPDTPPAEWLSRRQAAQDYRELLNPKKAPKKARKSPPGAQEHKAPESPGNQPHAAGNGGYSDKDIDRGAAEFLGCQGGLGEAGYNHWLGMVKRLATLDFAAAEIAAICAIRGTHEDCGDIAIIESKLQDLPGGNDPKAERDSLRGAAFNAGWRPPGWNAAPAAAQEPEPDTDNTGLRWVMTAGKMPRPKDGSTKNCVIALTGIEEAQHFRFNKWTGKIEYQDGDFEDPMEIPRLSFEIEKKYGRLGFTPNAGAIHRAVAYLAGKNSYNPVETKLRRIAWDGVPRLDTFAYDVFGIDRQDPKAEFYAAAAALILRGAVTRALEPGAKFPYMPNLYGPQGMGKGESLKIMSPGQHREGLPLDVQQFERDVKSALRGRSIVELAEISVLLGNKLERMKRLITNDTLDAKDAYAKQDTSLKLTAVLVGTTNSRNILSDEENRRFTIIKVNRVNLSLLKEQVGQLWAEAVSEFDRRPTPKGKTPNAPPRFSGISIPANPKWYSPGGSGKSRMRITKPTGGSRP